MVPKIFLFPSDKGTNRQKDGQTMIISMDPWSKKIFCGTNSIIMYTNLLAGLLVDLQNNLRPEIKSKIDENES